MEYNILEILSEYAKSVNYPFESICFSMKQLPEAFYSTIIAYMKRTKNNYDDSQKIQNLYICFDKERNAFFHIFGTDNHTSVSIISNKLSYGFLPSSFKINYNQFYSNLRILDEENNHKILNNLPEEFKSRFIKPQPEQITINNCLNKAYKNIYDYVVYMYEESKKHMDTIYFKDPDTSKNLKSIKKQSNIETNKDRKNQEIPFEEREIALNKYKGEYEINANSDSKTTYRVKVFKIKEKDYRIIMEPKEGNKYTKVIYLNIDNLTPIQIKNIVTDSLQLSREETTNKENITRHSHTTIDEYKKLLDYIIKDIDNGIAASTKYRINESINSIKK